MSKTRDSIRDSAEEICRLNNQIKITFREQPHGPRHSAACQAFHDAFDRLAFPGGLAAGLEGLRRHDPTTIESAIAFLAEDPRFFRSGYIKERILARLKTAPLSATQRQQLVRLIVRSVDSGGRREFHAYARLAGAMQAPEITTAMNHRLTTSPEVRRRAAEVLHVMESRRS